eukprot:IDg7804t1
MLSISLIIRSLARACEVHGQCEKRYYLLFLGAHDIIARHRAGFLLLPTVEKKKVNIECAINATSLSAQLIWDFELPSMAYTIRLDHEYEVMQIS